MRQHSGRQPFLQPTGRACAVTPPTVGATAHDVRAINYQNLHSDSVGERRRCEAPRALAPVGCHLAAAAPSMSGKPLRICCRCMTCRGMNSAIVNPTTSTAWSTFSDDASNLCTGQAARFGAEAEHNLVAVDGVDVEVDSGAGTAGAGEPIQDRGTRLPQLVRAERLKAPLGKVRIVVVGPRMEPHQGDSVRCDDRGKHRLHLRVAVPGERGDCHRVIAGVLTVAGTDIRVGVDPDDRKVVSVPVSERGERRDAHRALSTEGGDPAGLCWRMISSARASCSTTIALASTPSRSAKPSRSW